MPRDPLSTLLKVRKRLVDQSRLQLLACLEAEVNLTNRISTLDLRAQQNDEAGDRFAQRNRFLGMIANQRSQYRSQRAALVEALTRTETQTAAALATLVAVRTSAEVVDQLIQDRKADRDAEAEREAQHSLDDVARALHLMRRHRKLN